MAEVIRSMVNFRAVRFSAQGKERCVAPFSITCNRVSIGEYKGAQESGLYDNQRYWTDEGWAWRLGNNINYHIKASSFNDPSVDVYNKLAQTYRFAWNYLPVINLSLHEMQAFIKYENELESNFGTSWRLPKVEETEIAATRRVDNLIPSSPCGNILELRKDSESWRLLPAIYSPNEVSVDANGLFWALDLYGMKPINDFEDRALSTVFRLVREILDK